MHSHVLKCKNKSLWSVNGKWGRKKESVEHKAALCEGVKYGPGVRNTRGFWYKHTCMCRQIHSYLYRATQRKGFHSQLSFASALLMRELLMSLMCCVTAALSLLTQSLTHQCSGPSSLLHAFHCYNSVTRATFT